MLIRKAKNWLPFVGYASFLAFLSICKSFAIFSDYINALEKLAGGDKTLHLILATPLALLFLLMAENFLASLGVRILVCLVFLSGALLMDEVLQFRLSHRHFDWWDSLYGITGILLGCSIYLFGLGAKYQIVNRLNASAKKNV